MGTQETSYLDEVLAIQRISEAFAKLDDETKHRVVRWMIDKYQINQKHSSVVVSQNYDVLSTNANSFGGSNIYQAESNPLGGESNHARLHGAAVPILPPRIQETYKDFDELYAAALPETDAEKALIAAYWLQEHKSQEAIDSQGVNDLLKDLGYAITNITRAFGVLEDGSPQYVRLLKKEGSTRQARKSYKVTSEGCKKVRSMLEGKHEPLSRNSTSGTRAHHTRKRTSEKSEESPIRPTDISPSQFSSLTVRTIATQIGCKTGADLVLAACAQMTLVQSQEAFSRQQILDEIKTATNFYKASYASNLSNYIQTLIHKNKLLEQKPDVYVLSMESRTELEAVIDRARKA